MIKNPSGVFLRRSALFFEKWCFQEKTIIKVFFKTQNFKTENFLQVEWSEEKLLKGSVGHQIKL